MMNAEWHFFPGVSIECRKSLAARRAGSIPASGIEKFPANLRN